MGNTRTNMTVLLLSILITLLHSYLPHGLELPDYQTLLFSNPSRNLEFTRLAIHNETGNVYIGGADRLYRLSADFMRLETVEPSAVECDEDECPLNYNKVLLVDYSLNMLVTCGSESIQKDSEASTGGACQTRALDNIAIPLRDDDSVVVVPGKLSTEAVIAPGPDNGGVNTLYVAATYDEGRYTDVKPVSRRTYAASETTDIIFNVERDATLLLDTAKFPSAPFLIDYVYGFVNEHKPTSTHYTHFVTSQLQDFTSLEDKVYVSKINRVCHGFDFQAYAEITLECQGATPTNKYNLVQAAYVGPAGADLAASLNLNAGDNVLYGVFAKNTGVDGNIPSNQSALCIFKLDVIEDTFINGILGCLQEAGDYGLNYLRQTSCLGNSAITREQAIAQQCTAQNWAHADEFNPLVSTAAIEWSDITPSSIITTTHRSHTVAFVGTTDGELVKQLNKSLFISCLFLFLFLFKIHIEGENEGREYERFPLGTPSSPTGQVLRDAAVDNEQEHLTILTQQKLLKLNVSNCGAYTTCDDCIGGNGGQDGDPYCGWCTLEKRCTQHDECPTADESTRWLPYNNAQCVDISNVAPYPSQPISTDAREIILTVEQLPDLASDQFYQCVFDDGQQSRADKNGNELTCITPVTSNRPRIPAGSDHVTMILNVHSTETGVKFVSTEYDFYECDNHKMCVACTNSSWACDWCIYSNKCTHDNSTCSEDGPASIIGGVKNPNSGDGDGFEFCPQLAPQMKDVLVSVGVARRIEVTVDNLPPDKGKNVKEPNNKRHSRTVRQPSRKSVNDYGCILNVEGEKQKTSASRAGDLITCGAKAYSYDEEVHMKNVMLTLVWNMNGDDDREFDDIYGFYVTLYKCEVGRPDCSRCLSNITTMPELGCGWCQTDGICNVGDPVCTGTWIPPNTNVNCPSPMLTGVSPPSGPFEGNTIIAVSGTDLGQKFVDILSVEVGGAACSTEGLEDFYIAGSSVGCRTVAGDTDAEAEIAVRVMGSDGTPQDSTGEVVFTYRDPSISSFEPAEGPADGGTLVNIEGMYLDAGYDITAMIGPNNCVVDKNTITETSASCRTGKGTAGDSHTVKMSFDEAERESRSFSFRPNPQVFDVQPRTSIQSGGRRLRVTGANLRLAQDPMMIVYSGDANFTDTCDVMNDTIMHCKTPKTDVKYQELMMRTSNRKKRAAEEPTKLEFGFLIGDVQSLQDWSSKNNVTLDIYVDPTYEKFKANPDKYNGSILILMGQNLDYASSEEDVKVYVGREEAHVQSLDETTLTCKIQKRSRSWRLQREPNRCRISICISNTCQPILVSQYLSANTCQPILVSQYLSANTCQPILYPGNLNENIIKKIKIRNPNEVVHGNLEFEIGGLEYPGGQLELPIIITASICGLLVLMLIIAGLILRSRIKSHKEETSKLLVEMQNLETNIADDIRSAFAQLQTDVTDLTSDLEGTGMPFVSHRQYAMSMFFYGMEIQPASFDQENPDESMERAMLEFSKLLSNKTFLMAFIQKLDDDKKIPTKDKQNIASLLTVLMILEDKLAYLTDVMITLMSIHVQVVVDEDRPRQLFQRTETIVEKLLTNWIALSLYDFLKDHAAYPLFLLYRAIKCQSEKGPIDVMSGKSHFSLSDENVLNDDVEFEELTLQVIVNDEDGEKKEVKVLDVDTVSQVKEKILDCIYRNRPYSARQNAQQVDLEWRHGQSGHLVLQDVDVSSDTDPGWKKINTLKHFSVPNSSRMALVVKQTLPNAVVADNAATGATNYPYLEFNEKHSLLQKPYNMVDYQIEDGVQIWHLVKEQEGTPDDLPSSRKSKDKAATIAARSKKHIREINFPRLLSTKGTVQEYVDEMFGAILNTQDVPLGIKYIFDFFDSQAKRYDVMDGDVLHKWKSNTLPLRFWQNIITHPNYIFDVRQSQCVEASLRVVSQAFFDAFSTSDHKLGKNAPFNKLLYNREMPKYREMVDTYYSSVSVMDAVSKRSLDGELTNICQKFTGLFSRLSTLSKLYQMTKRYKSQLEEALEEDEQCQRAHLAEKLEEVYSMLEDDDGNDYLLQ
ncbi:plexin-A2-like [Amphiura filiformis]|uniref:plexin-A2-like n=1 Tax=Amphiura filiformis TaxID=82378 RepID=UPI003B212013